MSLRLEMLQAARLAPQVLGESTASVREFLLSQQNADGGFKDRSGASDLYYSVFGIEALAALGAELPEAGIAAYLRSWGDGASLDFVHVACLARCWANLAGGPPAELRPRIAGRIEAFRAHDGGYHTSPGSAQGNAYACFLAVGAYEDLALPLPDPAAVLACLDSVKAADGGYANQPAMPQGLTPPTAGAVVVLRQLGRTPPPELGQWLLARHNPRGGFFATPAAPLPDLLSTATALHALALMGIDLASVKEPCLGFLDALWSSRGGFHGHLADDALDCEYAFYALLSLGHLSLAGTASAGEVAATVGSHALANGFWQGDLVASPLATAIAIFALATADEHTDQPQYRPLVEGGMRWLAAHQNEDGGWGESVIGRSAAAPTAICWAALVKCSPCSVAAEPSAPAIARAREWLTTAFGGCSPTKIAAGIKESVGGDALLAAPALTLCALAGVWRDDRTVWSHVPSLPFELAALPNQIGRWLGLPSAPELLAPLIGLGLAASQQRPHPRGIRPLLGQLSRPRALKALIAIQDPAGSFCQSPALTALALIGLSAQREKEPAASKAAGFIAQSVRQDGSWALDAHFAQVGNTMKARPAK